MTYNFEQNYFSNAILEFIKSDCIELYHQLNQDDLIEAFVDKFATQCFDLAANLYHDTNISIQLVSEKAMEAIKELLRAENRLLLTL